MSALYGSLRERKLFVRERRVTLCRGLVADLGRCFRVAASIRAGQALLLVVDRTERVMCGRSECAEAVPVGVGVLSALPDEEGPWRGRPLVIRRQRGIVEIGRDCCKGARRAPSPDGYASPLRPGGRRAATEDGCSRSVSRDAMATGRAALVRGETGASRRRGNRGACRGLSECDASCRPPAPAGRHCKAAANEGWARERSTVSIANTIVLHYAAAKKASRR